MALRFKIGQFMFAEHKRTRSPLLTGPLVIAIITRYALHCITNAKTAISDKTSPELLSQSVMLYSVYTINTELTEHPN